MKKQRLTLEDHIGWGLRLLRADICIAEIASSTAKTSRIGRIARKIERNMLSLRSILDDQVCEDFYDLENVERIYFGTENPREPGERWFRYKDGRQPEYTKLIADQIDDVSRRMDILTIINGYTPLAVDVEYPLQHVGKCPFCHENTLHVLSTESIWHCFNCVSGGGAFQFVMRAEGLTFWEAVKHVEANLNGPENPQS